MEVTRSTDGDRADFPRLLNRYIIRSDATGGRFALIEHEILPRALAAPVHTHQHEDEYSFVLEGRVGVRIGDEEGIAEPGDLVAKPRGVPHAFWNAGEGRARLLELISPGGFERYFEEMAPHLNSGGPPDVEALAAIQGRYGLEMDFGSRAELAERHGLEA